MSKKRDRTIPLVDGWRDSSEYLHIVGAKFIKIDYHSGGSLHPELEKGISEISIKKRVFINKLDVSVSYVNYFIEYFDPDRTLLSIYFTLMYSIMNSEVKVPMDHFIDMLESMFSDTAMVEKISAMVDHNVDESMVKKKSGKQNDSLQLDISHLKAILAISVCYKMLIPLISQYYMVRGAEIPENIDDKNFYFLCFASIIPIFDEHYDVKIYNKFYHTASTRVSMITRKNRVIWDRLKNEGVTPLTHTNELIRNLFVDITQKTVFSRSTINYIHVCFDTANKNLLRTKTAYNYSTIEMMSGGEDDEMTPLDTLSINNARLSTKKGSMSRAIINNFIRNQCAEYGITITDEMRAYYTSRYRPTDAQISLVFSYLISKTSLGVQHHVKMDKFIDIMIIMKEYFESIGCIYLQYLVSGDYTASTPKRINKKKLDKYLEDYDIKDIYTFAGKHINKDKLFDFIKSLISPFVVLDYELYASGKLTERTEIKEADESLMIDELFRFVGTFDK